jgi:hypothetical protein
MTKRTSIGWTLAVCGMLLMGPLAATASAAEKPKLSAGEKAGVKLAETISTVTGVAISPLLGVGAVGAWQWCRGDATTRPKLPWFAQPGFWVPALLVVAAVFAKDALGTTLPASLKKPFDVAEAIENKISGLIAAGAFVPLIASVSESLNTSASLGDAGFATMNFSWLLNLVTVPVAMAAFVIVWLVANSINMLILISPFGAVDAALKSFRMAVLGSVTLTSFVNPYAGAVWSLIIIVICYFLAGWSFRTLVFGNVFIWDLVTFRHRRFHPSPTGNWMFLARKTERVPIRTFGRVHRTAEGRLVLKYRPWLVLPERSLLLPEGKYAIGRGLLYPELMLVDGQSAQTMFRLPPHYRRHEEELTRLYQLEPVQDVGLKAMWKWLKEVFGFKGSQMPAPSTPAA